MKHLLLNHNYAFLKLIAFRLQMVLAYQMIAVAVGWHIYEITHDPLSLGLIGLSEVITYFSCALFAGHAIDYYLSRRFFATLSAVLLGLNALFLTLLSSGQLENLLAGKPVYWIYASIAFTGIARAFIAPSYNTLFALIIPREKFAKASGLGSALFQAGLVLGPAMGGLIVGYASKTIAYGLASALCFGAALTMLMLTLKEPPKQDAIMHVFQSIQEGLRFVFNKQVILAASSLDMFAVLFGGATALLPAFIQDVYQLGAESLGLLRASPAVGSILIGLWLAKRPINQNAGKWLLTAVACFGISIIGFGLAKSFYVAMLMLFFSGIFDGLSMVLRQTILQLATPDNMRGRVSAINGLFIGSSNEIGAFESGVTAKLFGLIPAVILGGCMTLGVVAATAKFAPKLRNLSLNDLN